MRLFILLQVFVAVEICKSEDQPNKTIILSDSQTELMLERGKNPSGSSASELFDSFSEVENDGNDLDFDYDNDENTFKAGLKNPEQEMQEIFLKAMRKPAVRKQIGEVIPILRVMSPVQRLTLAALVSSQITSQKSPSEKNLIDMAASFENENIKNASHQYNITEHLLLPISMDIAKMFKGLGKEMGRNLRRDLRRPTDYFPTESSIRREIRNKNQLIINRRMDDYDQFEDLSSTMEPVAEALKQPGKDECDYFTKSLCLEVSNYPTEAIILSIKMNQDIADTFLTDFDLPQEDEHKLRSQVNGRGLERRQDNQNEVQDFAPKGGYMCPSSVKYARPKRARATSGQWKYIVNAGDYTQTLRLEICQKPKLPCSYLTNHLNSQCTQIYNYHRLLTWDESKGLHMDIFKVPSCCSCHIQGYSTFFPPNKDFTFAEKRREPSEGADSLPEPQIQPPYGYLGNKREVSQNVPNENSLPGPTKNHSYQIREFYRNPVDHLVPPGPPLPLENEDHYNIYTESSHSQKNLPPEQNQRYPVQAEHRRITSKVSEGNDLLQGLILSSDPRLNEPNIKYNKAHSDIISNLALEKNPVTDSKNQIQLIKPSPITLRPFPSLETLKKNPSDVSVFITPNPKDSMFPSGSKINPKHPSQYFKTEFLDTKTLSSRIKPSYVTPPKLRGMEGRISTTSGPPQKSELFTASGQKKINYNYHPIIDFFLSDSKKRQPVYSSSQYRPLAPQDWTPVLGH